MNLVTFDDFIKIEMRIGTVIEAVVFEKARKPAYQLKVDFGPETGIKQSSAQLTHLYTPEELVGKQVVGVVNFPPRQIANFFSEVLVLGFETAEGVVLLQPERSVQNGIKVS